MKIARFSTGEDPRYGVLVGGDDGVRPDDGAASRPWLAEITGDPLYTPIAATGRRWELDEVRLLAPVIPRSKVIGIGRNYAEHAGELGNEVPAEPLMFLVPNTAVVGPDDPVVIPPQTADCHYEGELAVVIGRMCKAVSPDRAAEVIFGYTCANDVTARDLQRTDGQWARAKGFDTFCPLGPWIETELDVRDLALRVRLDGELVQDGRTSDMVHDVPALVAAVSQAFTLLPGDVILTGTPAGVGPVRAGQRVEVEVAGIGVLSNPFVRR